MKQQMEEINRGFRGWALKNWISASRISGSENIAL